MRSSDRQKKLSRIPPWPSREGFVFLMVTLFSAALVQAADLRLTVERTHPLEFSWETASVTQPGSISIIPETQLEASTDLIHWQPLGQAQPGGLGALPLTVSRTIGTATGPRYFR
ncbi:hypothetical protein OAA59_00915, partial [bacterium]|nr:hypothetical protein [bacterium]